LDPVCANAEVSRRPNHDLFEIADVSVHVTAVGAQIHDRVAHKLAGPVIRDVAAAPRFVGLHSAPTEQLLGRNEVGTRSVQLHTERDDVRMLEQQQEIGNATGATLFHESPLHLRRSRIWHHAEMTDFQRAHELTRLQE
jgi:hypothetical protein